MVKDSNAGTIQIIRSMQKIIRIITAAKHQSCQDA
jgi:hypothetical protein